jgi:hypothetical protein
MQLSVCRKKIKIRWQFAVFSLQKKDKNKMAVCSFQFAEKR